MAFTKPANSQRMKYRNHCQGVHSVAVVTGVGRATGSKYSVFPLAGGRVNSWGSTVQAKGPAAYLHAIR